MYWTYVIAMEGGQKWFFLENHLYVPPAFEQAYDSMNRRTDLLLTLKSRLSNGLRFDESSFAWASWGLLCLHLLWFCRMDSISSDVLSSWRGPAPRPAIWAVGPVRLHLPVVHVCQGDAPVTTQWQRVCHRFHGRTFYTLLGGTTQTGRVT